MHHFSTKLGRYIEGNAPGVEGHPPTKKIETKAPGGALDFKARTAAFLAEMEKRKGK